MVLDLRVDRGTPGESAVLSPMGREDRLRSLDGSHDNLVVCRLSLPLTGALWDLPSLLSSLRFADC